MVVKVSAEFVADYYRPLYYFLTFKSSGGAFQVKLPGPSNSPLTRQAVA